MSLDRDRSHFLAPRESLPPCVLPFDAAFAPLQRQAVKRRGWAVDMVRLMYCSRRVLRAWCGIWSSFMVLVFSAFKFLNMDMDMVFVTGLERCGVEWILQFCMTWSWCVQRFGARSFEALAFLHFCIASMARGPLETRDRFCIIFFSVSASCTGFFLFSLLFSFASCCTYILIGLLLSGRSIDSTASSLGLVYAP